MLIVTALLALFHWRPPLGLWFLVGGLAVFAVADVWYVSSAANGTYQPGGLNDAIWVLATLLMGFAPGWSKQAVGRSLPAWLLLGIPVLATLVAVSLLVYSNSNDVHPIADLARRRDRGRLARPHGRDLPRGHHAGAQPPARADRRADRPGQPPRVLRAGAVPARRVCRTATPPRCSCSTWTGSRRSTTPSGTTRATTCSATSPSGCSARCTARATCWPGWAATSSPSSCTTSTPRAPRPWRPA